MSILIFIALILGILVGNFLLGAEFLTNIDTLITISLNLLIFIVGIDIGSNKEVFGDLKKHGLKILLIPIGTIIGTLLGGIVAGLALDLPINLSLAISSGFGWYSLSGVLISKLDSSKMGAVAFLTNVFRELLAIMTIPIISKKLNKFTAIAPAGATSMDTTLPLISKYTDSEVAVIAFVNGFILSSLVPFLVPLFYKII
ncbi:LysO family transporter [Clostridium sp. DL1XJH146]